MGSLEILTGGIRKLLEVIVRSPQLLPFFFLLAYIRVRSDPPGDIPAAIALI